MNYIRFMSNLNRQLLNFFQKRLERSIKSKWISLWLSVVLDFKYWLKVYLLMREPNLAGRKRTVFTPIPQIESSISLPERIDFKEIYLFFDRYFYGTRMESDTYRGLVYSIERNARKVQIHDRAAFINISKKIDFCGSHMIFDGNQLSELEVPILETARSKGSRITVIAQDSWAITQINRLKIWEKYSDCIVYFDKNSELEKWIDQSKLRLSLPPRELLVPSHEGSHSFPIRIGFSGSLGPSRIEWIRRLFTWTSRLKTLSLDVRLHTKSNNDGSFPSYNDYLRWLFDMDVIINFTFKASNRYILNGRTMDTLGAGKVLVQQVGSIDSLSAFFQPEVHYFPFRSKKDLQGILTSIANISPDTLATFGRNSKDFYDYNYRNLTDVILFGGVEKT